MDGQLIGNRYQLEQLIGTGGMGTVYKGTDTQTGQPVAIKHLKPEIVIDNPELVTRFEREGEALRQLNHPNIVNILETLEEGSNHYLIIEYIGGGDLREILQREGKLTIDQTLKIALDLADALTRAHRLKIIHRDLKPANILIAPDGTPRLTDFGVARVGTAERVTQPDSVIGTLSYLSPESFSGEEIDERTDIWAFGVILFELLTGFRPFDGTSPTVTMLSILQRPLPDICKIRPDTPPALARLIERMLVKDYTQRIRSVRLVAAQLEALITGAEIPPEDTPPTSHFLHRFEADIPTAMKTFAESLIDVDNGDTQESGPIQHKPHHPPAPAAAPLTIETDTRQIRRSTDRWRYWIAGAVALVVMVAGLAGVFLLYPRFHATPKLTCTISQREFMVLVADMEAIGTPDRDVHRFIADDLTQTLEVGMPFSTIRICRYPRIIRSDKEALEAAEKYGASVVVWGNYDSQFIDLTVQVGATTAFPNISMPQHRISDASSVRVRLENERTQSIAAQVLGAQVALHNADGDGYECARILTMLDELNVVGGEIIGDSHGAHGHKYILNFIDNPEIALEEISKALELDRNPIAYMSRAGIYLRLGDLTAFRQDVLTAARLGPSDWPFPDYMFANLAMATGDLDGAKNAFTRVIERRPDDWFSYNIRGTIYYFQRDYAAANADITRAISLKPNANFPYLAGFMLALREGDVAAAQTAINTVLTEYPDPTFGNRLVNAVYGESTQVIFAPVFSAFGNLILGEYRGVLENVEAAVAIDPEIPDLYLLRGFAYCNLRDYPAAEAAYDQAIALDPNFPALYVLRAETRLRQNNILGAAADVATVLSGDQGDIWRPIVIASQAGEVNCENLLEFDLASLLDN